MGIANKKQQRQHRQPLPREDFRPFAPSVLAEEAEDWFEGLPPDGRKIHRSFMTLNLVVYWTAECIDRWSPRGHDSQVRHVVRGRCFSRQGMSVCVRLVIFKQREMFFCSAMVGCRTAEHFLNVREMEGRSPVPSRLPPARLCWETFLVRVFDASRI